MDGPLLWLVHHTYGAASMLPAVAYYHREDAIREAEDEWKRYTGDNYRPLVWGLVATDTTITVARPKRGIEFRIFPVRVDGADVVKQEVEVK